MKDDSIIVMAIKPKYAKMIYEGKKVWEFRKAPPPLGKMVLIYESAPVSAVTGTVTFLAAISGDAETVWGLCADAEPFFSFCDMGAEGDNPPGITRDELKDYAGKTPVTALRCAFPKRLPQALKLGCPPPQNWGRLRRDKLMGSEVAE